MLLSPVDLGVLALLLVSMAVGAWRGLVYEVMAVLGWLAAFVFAYLYAEWAAQRMPVSGLSEPLQFAAGFVTVFVAVAFAGGLVATITRKLVALMGVRPVDRTLGAAFGLLRGFIMLLGATVVVLVTPLQAQPLWRESLSSVVLGRAIALLQPMLPEEFTRYLPS